MTTIRRISLFAAAGMAALSAAAASHAQDAASQIDEIVVTAQKREQKTLDVPMALTAYRGDFLEKIGVQEFDRLSLFVPGFVVQNQSPNNPGFVMRGITSDSGDSTVEPRVSVFQDGVSISKSRGSYIELFDIQRIEVAKGPQSTLFGRGALIGAVNVIQNKADPSALDWRLRAEYGNDNYGLFEGMANVPVTPDLAVRFAGRFKHRDGPVGNLLGGEPLGSTDTGALRLSAHWTPTDRLTVDLIGNYEADHPTGTAFKSNTFDPTNPTTGQVLGDRSPNSPAALSSGYGFEGGADLGVKRYVQGVTALVDYRISDAFKLSSITAARHFQSEEVFDPDGFSLPMLTFAEDARGSQYSQEFRLNYDEGGRFTWFAGVSAFGENGRQRVPVQIDERYALALIAGQIARPDPQPAAVLANPAFSAALLKGLAGSYGYALPTPIAQGVAANLKAPHLESYANFGETTAYDVYGDVTWRATDKIEISAGLRYTTADKTSRVSSAVLNGRSVLGGVMAALSLPEPNRTALLAALAAPGAAAIPQSAGYPVPLFGIVAQPTANNGDKQSADLTDDGLTWRLVGRYKPSPTLSFYASYARGRRPEVLTAGAPSTPQGAARFMPVSAETVDSYEIGAKALLDGGRLSLEGAVYDYEYDHFQTTVQQGALLFTTDAGQAQSYGFEGQATRRPAPWADLFAAYGYNHGRFSTGLYKNNQFRLAPDHKLSVGAALSVQALAGRFTFTPTYTWQSKIFFDDDNDIPALQKGHLLPDFVQDEYQKPYGLLDLRLDYQPSFSSNWSVGAFVTNALDEKYIKDAGNTGDAFGIPTFIAGSPRYYGVTVTIRR